ncbi:MAG: lamin tail domain-containing protein, partial [Acidimicrobiia bacterium]|nr:lamin tail domain-containing protein [Acidimicrobiia bacterium]
SNPGFTILESGTDLDLAGPGEYVTWSITPAVPLELDGPLTLDLWSTVAGFALGESSHIVVGIYDCDVLVPTSCTLLVDEDVHKNNWNGGVADWVNHQFNLGTLTHTVGVGRALVAKAVVKHGDLWIATTADYPSRFVYTAANLPPATNPDAYPGPSDPDYLEDDLSTITIDVAANDIDTDIDLASLAIRTDLDPDDPHDGDPTPADLSLGTITAFPDGTVTYVLDPDMFGVDVFVYEICDTNAECSTEMVTVTILEVNDMPTFTPGTDITGIAESDGNQSIDPWATDIVLGPANEADQKLDNLSGDEKFEVTVPDPTEAAYFRDLPEIDKDGKLTFQYEKYVHGTATVVVSLRDDGGVANGGVDQSAAVTFDITVDPVNDVPHFKESADPDVDEDTGPHTYAAWATEIEAATDAPPGPWDESSQVLTFTVDPQGPGDLDMFDPAGLPAIDPATGDLTFTLKPDAHGTANLTATLTDDATMGGPALSFSRDFKINVDPVDDAPNAVPGTPSIDEDGGAQTITIGGIDAGGSGAWVEAPTTIELVSATSGDLAIVSDATITYTSPNPTADLSFTPVADRSGTVTISLTLLDWGKNGIRGDADDVSQVLTFPLAVTEVNDPPTISDPADVDVLTDAGPQSIATFVSMTTAGTPDEDTAGQGVDSYILVQTGTSNPALFGTVPSIDVAGTLTFESAAGETGTATYDVQVKDNGGAPGDTSAAKSFTIAVSDPIADIRMIGLAPASDADDPAIALLGIPAIQTAYLHNDGPDLARAVRVVMPIDTALAVFDAANSSAGCVFIAGPDVIDCAIGDVAAGADASAVLSVIPIAGGSTPYVLTTTTASTDPDPFDNTGFGFVRAIPPAADVVISEYSTDRADDFVEIYNPTAAPMDISNWTIRVYPPDGTAAFVTVATVPLATSLAPHTHYLFANAVSFANAGTDATFDVALYGGVELVSSGGGVVDGAGAAPRPGGDPLTEAGAASREGTGLPPMTPGAAAQSMERLHGESWDGSGHGSCVDTDDNATNFRHQLGSGVNPEGTVDGAELCAILATIPPSSATSVVISEFRGDGPAGGGDEFVEIFNATDATVSLDGWALQFHDGVWQTAYNFGVAAVLSPYEHFLIATVDGTVSIAPSVPDAQYGPGAGVSPFGSSTGITLKNGGALQLVDGAAATVDLVGMVGVPAEGTPLPKFDGRGTHTFERVLG